MKLPLMQVSMTYSFIIQDMPEDQIRNFLIRNIANELEKMDIPIQDYVNSQTGERIHRMQLYIATEDQFNEFVAEVRAVARTKHPATIDLMYSDYRQVKTEERFGQFVYNRIGLEVNNSYNETDDEVAWQTLRSFCATWFK